MTGGYKSYCMTIKHNRWIANLPVTVAVLIILIQNLKNCTYTFSAIVGTFTQKVASKHLCINGLLSFKGNEP